MADSSNGIPIMHKPSDAMSNGLNSNNLAASAMARHPIDRMQRGEYNFSMNVCKNIYYLSMQ